ncbi:MAG TPA: MerR family transcriptional regulator [Trueperaceae bacterium]
MNRGKYTVNEVEERTKVPGSTLRQWERRYGFPKPQRSESGYRLYSELDLGHIDAMKRHIAEGIPASRAAELVRGLMPMGGGARPVRQLQDELVAALVGLEEEGARRLLSEAHSLHPLDVVVLQLIPGSLRRLDELWQQGSVESAVLSYAAGYLQGRLLALADQAPLPRGAAAVAVAAAPDDRHELGAVTLMLMLRRAGLRAYYTGDALQLPDLAMFAQRLRPVAVLISATTDESLERLERDRGYLVGVAPLLGLGGGAFDRFPDAAEAVGGEYLGGDIAQALQRLRQRLHGQEAR